MIKCEETATKSEETIAESVRAWEVPSGRRTSFCSVCQTKSTTSTILSNLLNKNSNFNKFVQRNG